MTAQIIQFIPRPNPRREPAPNYGWFYEHMLGQPEGSFRGVWMGVPIFEVPDVNDRT